MKRRTVGRGNSPWLQRGRVAAMATALFGGSPVQALSPGDLAGVKVRAAGAGNTPAVAMDADGDLMVNWRTGRAGSGGYEEAYLRGFDPFLRHAPLQLPATPLRELVAAPDGDVVGARDPRPGCSECQAAVMLLNPRTYGTMTRIVAEGAFGFLVTGTSVAVDADGDFVVTWSQQGPGSDGESTTPEVRARRYFADGTAAGEAFAVHAPLEGAQDGPAIGIDAQGNFVIAWQDRAGLDGSSLGVFAQRFDAAGLPVGGSFRVPRATEGPQAAPQVAMAPDGDFVIAWTDYGVTPSRVMARVYAADGHTRRPPFGVGPDPVTDQILNDLAIDARGRFVVAWNGALQRYGASGLPEGGALSFPGVRLAMDADGDFVTIADWLVMQRVVGPEPVDLSLQMAPPFAATPGQAAEFVMSVANRHGQLPVTGVATIDAAIGAASGVRVTDVLAPGTAFRSAGGFNWRCTHASGTVRCDYDGVLRAGASTPPLRIRTSVPEEGARFVNTASVTSFQFDPRPDNDSDSVETRVSSCAAGTVAFLRGRTDAEEAEPKHRVVLRRTGALSSGARVFVGTEQDYRAIAGADFTPVQRHPVDFAPDQDSQAVSLDMLDDALDETVEAFRLRIEGGAGEACVGLLNSQQITIHDDDPPPLLTLASGDQVIPEDGGTATIMAELSAPRGDDTLVSFVLNPPSAPQPGAGRGVDYALNAGPFSGSILIPEGDTRGFLQIHAVDDALNEFDETLLVRAHEQPIYRFADPELPPQNLITIADDDPQPVVQFAPAPAATPENRNPATIHVSVRLSQPSGRDITVPFSLSGSASRAEDYTLEGSAIVIRTGRAVGGVTLTLVDDAVPEPDETVELQLGTPVNAALGSRSQYTLTIDDND